MRSAEFKIDLSEAFERLPNAPIVEAVIRWQARSGKKFEPDAVHERLIQDLPDYPNSQRQHALEFGGVFPRDGPSIEVERDARHGFRFETTDKRQVAQFSRNGFVFSRLRPYEGWEEFEREAQRLWKTYCELAEPSEVQRLSVRFINRIPLESLDQLSDLLATPPSSPDAMQFPLKGFLHQATFAIPSHPYHLNVTQTIQPPSPQASETFGYLLDFEVFTTRPILLDEIANRLPQMQWIKNKAFFTFLKAEAMTRFREQPR